MQGEPNGRDKKKERYWRRVIGEDARSGVSVRQFCPALGGEAERGSVLLVAVPPQAGKKRQQARALGSGSRGKATKDAGQATFALVSEEAEELGSAGIELVLRGGRRLRIGKGVDERTLRTVVGVLEASTFQFPLSETGRKEVAAWELAILLEGIDLKKGKRRKRYRLPSGVSSGHPESRQATPLPVGER